MKKVLSLILLLLPMIAFAQTSCNCGQETTLDAGSGFSNYLWSNGETTQTITLDPSCPSDGQLYTVTLTDDCGIQYTETENVSICTASQITINDAFYVGSAQFCLLLVNNVTCCENPIYQWTDPCGTIVSTSNVLNTSAITVCGLYTAELLSCNGCTECSSSATYNIINGQQNSPDCCGGTCGCVGCSANITQFSASSSCNNPVNYSAVTCTGAALSWSATLGGSTVATGTGQNFTFTPSQNGTYTITLTVLDDCGITSTDQVTTFVVNCSNNCQDCSGSTIITNGIHNCNAPSVFSVNCSQTTNYTWSITGGGGSVNGSVFTYTPTQTGTYTVSVSFVDECGNFVTDSYTFSVTCVVCEDCSGAQITVNNNPDCNTQSIFSLSCNNPSNVNWSVNIGTGQVVGNTFRVTPSASGSYQVTVSFIDECGDPFTRTYSYTIACAALCDCNVSVTPDDIDCELDIVVTGPNCSNYTLVLLNYGSNDGSCTMGNCALQLGTLPAVTQTIAAATCSSSSDISGDYKAALFPVSGSGCTFKEDCTTVDCEPPCNFSNTLESNPFAQNIYNQTSTLCQGDVYIQVDGTAATNNYVGIINGCSNNSVIILDYGTDLFIIPRVAITSTAGSLDDNFFTMCIDESVTIPVTCCQSEYVAYIQTLTGVTIPTPTTSIGVSLIPVNTQVSVTFADMYCIDYDDLCD